MKTVMMALMWGMAVATSSGAAEVRPEDRQAGDARLRAEALVGRPLVSSDGRKLGDIRRVLVDDTGYLVTLGVAVAGRETLVAVPAAHTRLSDTSVVFNAETGQLAELPPFESDTPVIQRPGQTAR